MLANTHKQAAMVGMAVLILAFASCGYLKYIASDSHRLSLFRSHRAEYELLLNMLQHDGHLIFINDALTTPDDPSSVGISPQRIAEYRRLMSNIGCGAISYGPEIGSALFVADWGRAADILYFPVQSHAVAKNLGIPVDRPPPQAHRIVGDWYLSSD